MKVWVLLCRGQPDSQSQCGELLLRLRPARTPQHTLSVPFWAQQILLLLWAPWLHKERLLNYTPWHIIVPDVFVGGLQPWTKIIADTKAEPWPLYWLKIRKWLSLSLSLSPGCYLCLCCQPRLSQSHAWSSLEMCRTANSGHYMSPGPCVSM